MACTTTTASLASENNRVSVFGVYPGMVLEQSYNIAMISSLVTSAFGHRRVLKAFQASDLSGFLEPISSRNSGSGC